MMLKTLLIYITLTVLGIGLTAIQLYPKETKLFIIKIKYVANLYFSGTEKKKPKAHPTNATDQQNPFTTSNQLITWSHSDSRHHHILKGEFKDMAPGDVAMNMAISDLPDFNHTKTIANNKRFENLSTHRTTCNPHYAKTERRLKYLYYSEPYFFFKDFVIIFHKSDEVVIKTYLQKDRTIDFDRLIKETNLFAGLYAGAMYSEPLQTIVDKFRNAKHAYERYAQFAPEESLLKMFAKKRYDVYLTSSNAYASAMAYLNLTEDPYIIFKIKPTQITYIHLVCSKTPAGKKIIDQINSKSIEKIRKQAFRNILVIFKKFPDLHDWYEKKYQEGESLQWKSLPAINL